MKLNVRNAAMDDELNEFAEWQNEQRKHHESARLAEKARLITTQDGYEYYESTRFVRFMSHEEYDHLMNGDEIINLADHYKHCRTNSFGCCFLPIDMWEYQYSYESEDGECDAVETYDELNRYASEWTHWNRFSSYEEALLSRMYEKITGTCSDEVAVIFTANAARLKSCGGTYANMYDYWGTAYVREFSTPIYDRKTMVPVAAFDEWGTNYGANRYRLF